MFRSETIHVTIAAQHVLHGATSQQEDIICAFYLTKYNYASLCDFILQCELLRLSTKQQFLMHTFYRYQDERSVRQ
jgi:hypothetical protein